MNNKQVKGLEDFFTYVWRDTEAYVYLPVLKEGRIEQYMFDWPRQKSAVIKHVLRNVAANADVHYSPALYSKARPQKENVLGTWVLWADFDGTAPEGWVSETVPEPTLRVQSSGPQNQHTYWALDKLLTDIPTIDERNRALAYALHADTGGWDANQFLRPPFTVNTGYGKDREPTEVKISGARRGRINLDALSEVPTVGETIESEFQLAHVPDIDEVLREGNWPADFWRLFHETRDNIGDRSEAMVKLGFFGHESGFTNEQIYAVLDDADKRWGKYTHRRDREKLLIDIISYVRERKGHVEIELPDEITVSDQVVYGFQEILDTEVQMNWVIEGLMPEQGFGVITGDPGVGKTQLGIQLACSLALGEDFIGWKNGAGKKKVLFLSLEMSLMHLKRFMELIAKEYTDDMQRHLLQQNFKTLPLGEGIPFDRPEGQTFIDSLLSEYMPDVVFIDSLQKTISQEITDELAIRKFTEYLKKHVRHKFGCAVYIIHHNRKGQGDTRTAATLNDMYGSRFLSAELDFALNVTKLTRHRVTIDMTKNRLDVERERFDLERNEHLKYSEIESVTDTNYLPNARVGYEEDDHQGANGANGESPATFAL